MNTTDYLVASDVSYGIVAAILERLSGHVSNEKMWKPFVENTVLSVIGRMGESYLSGSMFSKKTEGKPDQPYIRTAQGRSGLIIYISDMILQYIMKNKNKYGHSLLAVASDSLGNEIVGALLEKDSVLIAKKV